MKILFVAGESLPFIASGGLADVAYALPKQIAELKHECAVVIPLYERIPLEFKNKFEFVRYFYVDLSWRHQYCGVFKTKINNVTYYFLDNEYYFKRNGFYGFFDDCERFAFFSKAILEFIEQVNFVPNIIHTNDWHTALVPVYLNLFYKYKEKYNKIKTVFTIHNINYQGQFGTDVIDDVLGIHEIYQKQILKFGFGINFMKGAIEQADKVTTVSESYANEILHPWFGKGLDEILNKHRDKLCGIVNGIDTDMYNPSKDSRICKNYSLGTLSLKLENKKELCRKFGLRYDDNVPIIGLTSRFTENKGIDLLICVVDDIIKMGMQIIVVGEGDTKYECFFKWAERKYQTMFKIILGFSSNVARNIYAGADMLLMPSRTEPCGISQMIALRYGCIPIVRQTGGLKDTIIDYGDENGYGFTFKTYNAHDMLNCIARAKNLYHDVPRWKEIAVRAMKCDFSWNTSVLKYINVYNQITGLA